MRRSIPPRHRDWGHRRGDRQRHPRCRIGPRPGSAARGAGEVFLPFYRAARHTAAAVNGTGLGLAICRGLVEAQGGAIWVESSGDGCFFVFTLPLATESGVNP